MSKRLLFIVNTPEAFMSHRLPIAEQAKQEGYEVHIATGGQKFQSFLEKGFHHHLLPLSRSGKNPLKELKAVVAIFRLMQQLKPQIVHLVTIKPVLYGGICARLTRIKGTVMAIPGVGYTYTKKNLKAYILRLMTTKLYRFVFNSPNIKVIFQNPDDRAMMIEKMFLDPTKTILLRGSGISLNQYIPIEEEQRDTPIIVMASRLLKDKGVFEFIESAKQLQSKGIKATFWLVGSLDPGNPETLSPKEFSAIQTENIVECLGFQSNIADIFAKANIVVLPSYREGLPKVLQEAQAAGRAVITTDVPGCRDAIIPNETGLLVPVKNADALAGAIEFLIKNPEKRKQFALAGRALAESAFDITKIAEAHLSIYNELMQ